MRLADPISSRHVAVLNVFRHIVVECGAGRAMLQVRSSNNQTSVAVVQKYRPAILVRRSSFSCRFGAVVHRSFTRTTAHSWRREIWPCAPEDADMTLGVLHDREAL
jgi:hypothetical protein